MTGIRLSRRLRGCIEGIATGKRPPGSRLGKVELPPDSGCRFRVPRFVVRLRAHGAAAAWLFTLSRRPA